LIKYILFELNLNAGVSLQVLVKDLTFVCSHYRSTSFIRKGSESQ